MKYFLNEPSISRLEKKYVSKALNANWLSINGENTKIFEKKFSNFIGIKNSLGVQSGTAALHLALKAANIKPKDKVIIPNFSCVASISSTSQCGAIPIIVEVERETLGLDFQYVVQAVKKFKPKAIQLVHVYGVPARDTEKIKNFCNKKKIILIEDASEALGAKIKNKNIGTFGKITIFSIRSEKMIGVGEGGVICSNNKKIYERIKLLAARSAPFRSSKNQYWKKYFHLGEGYNYLMPHLLGSVARGQIERFKNYMMIKKINVGKLYRKFTYKNFIFTQKDIKNHKSVYWLNSLYFKNLSSEQVKKLGNFLMKKNIEIRSGFWPLANLKNFNSKYVGGKKVSKEMFEKTLVVPSTIHLKEKDIKYILSTIENFINKKIFKI